MTAVLEMTSSDGRRLRRYPFGSVERAISRRTGLPLHQQGCPCPHEKCCSATVIAAHLGTSARQVHRWRAADLPLAAADRVATELGLRVEDLWDET